MQSNSWMIKTVIGAAVLVIIVAGVLIIRRITASSDETPRVVYKLPETRNSEQRRQLLNRLTRSQVRRVPKTATTRADDRNNAESSPNNSAADAIDTQDSFDNSEPQVWDEAEQNEGQIDYDKRFDTLMGVTRKMGVILAETKPINEELDRMLSEWSRNIRDPENLTEDEVRQGEEIKEEVDSMVEALQELNKRLDAFIEEIASAVPGAVRTESFAPNLQHGSSMQRVSIDYQYIRSALGAPPEEYDAHLSEFFRTFHRVQ